MGELIDFSKYKLRNKDNKDKQSKEEAEIILAKEKMQAYADFLTIIEKIKKLDNKKEMHNILTEIAKASLRKLPPEKAIEVIKHYEKILSHYFSN